MTDTQEILRRVAALRARLDQAHGLLQEADSAAGALARPETAEVAGKIKKGEGAGALIDSALRPLSEDETTLPVRLTPRAMRLVHHGRHLLATLRHLAADRAIRGSDLAPRGRLHRETVTMLETVMRTVQAFPPAPSAQLRLCEGLEAVLDVVHERVKVLEAACQCARDDKARVDHLASLLRKLATGQTIRGRDWHALTDALAKEAQHNAPLKFFRAGADDMYRYIAAHGLNVAQVLARVLLQESEWQGHEHECLMAALLHDVGLVHCSAEILAQPHIWESGERRQVEKHTTIGAELLARVFAPGSMIVEAAQDHHERMDGTGYPNGKREMQISAFTRLLSACDLYTALCSGRPHRPAHDTRTALTDTLLEADRGALDKFQAEKLLRLSFYPVGSVVELADGAVGMVAATHAGEKGLLNPAKPIVLLLAEAQGQPLPQPRLVDLLVDEERSIVRTLPAEARLPLLGRHYPELV
jgi:HD-GYP domain-containing protein (c-di-GMP phosphodiesterase class II)